MLANKLPPQLWQLAASYLSGTCRDIIRLAKTCTFQHDHVVWNSKTSSALLWDLVGHACTYRNCSLCAAIRHGAPINQIRILADRVDINQPSLAFWNSPLHWACTVGHIEAVEYLLGRGANVNCFNGPMETPLMLAVKMNRQWIVSILLAHGAYIDKTVMEAAKLPSIRRLLLEHIRRSEDLHTS